MDANKDYKLIKIYCYVSVKYGIKTEISTLSETERQELLKELSSESMPSNSIMKSQESRRF